MSDEYTCGYQNGSHEATVHLRAKCAAEHIPITEVRDLMSQMFWFGWNANDDAADGKKHYGIEDAYAIADRLLAEAKK